MLLPLLLPLLPLLHLLPLLPLLLFTTLSTSSSPPGPTRSSSSPWGSREGRCSSRTGSPPAPRATAPRALHCRCRLRRRRQRTTTSLLRSSPSCGAPCPRFPFRERTHEHEFVNTSNTFASQSSNKSNSTLLHRPPPPASPACRFSSSTKLFFCSPSLLFLASLSPMESLPSASRSCFSLRRISRSAAAREAAAAAAATASTPRVAASRSASRSSLVGVLSRSVFFAHAFHAQVAFPAPGSGTASSDGAARRLSSEGSGSRLVFFFRR